MASMSVLDARLLLMPFSPILLICAIFVYCYERIFFNNRERVDTTFNASRYTTGFAFIVGFLITFPFVCCGPCGQLIASPLRSVLNIVIIGTYELFHKLFWQPVFDGESSIVCLLYKWINQGLYKSLPLEKDLRQKRVIEILPGSLSHAIEVRIFVDSIENPQEPYEALSYSWGGHFVLRRVISANRRRLVVTDSVFNALRELRSPVSKRRVWIDAVCINQKDVAERNHQINQMGDIYRNAQSVVVWLGKAPIHFDYALDLIHEFAHLESTGSQTPKEPDNDAWKKPLRDLMARRWWARVWVVQEVVLNDNVEVHIGSSSIPWETLVTFVRFASRSNLLPLDDKVLNFATQVTELKRLAPGNPQPKLIDLALRFRNRIAGRPEDKLFGLLGLLHSTVEANPNPEERISAPEVFVNFAASNIQRIGDLSVMMLAESRSSLDCSWAVDWAKWTDSTWAQADPLDVQNMEAPFSATTPFWNGGLVPSNIQAAKTYNADSSLPSVKTFTQLQRPA